MNSVKLKPFLFFIHIPKTAGSSFLDLVTRLYGHRFYGVYSNVHNEQPFTRKQLIEFVADFDAIYDCLASHRLSADFPDRVGERRCLGVSFVRDPFDLFVSHYYYHRFHSVGFAAARKLNLQDYFEYAIEQNNHPHYCNWQSHVLRGCKDKKEALTFDSLKKRIESDQFYVFPTSEFDISCTLLEHIYPEIFQDVWYKRRNVSKKDQEIPEGLRERFFQYAEEDYQLIGLAQTQTQRFIEKVFPNEYDKTTALTAFRKRNKWKKYMSIPRAGLRKLLSNLLEAI